MSTEILTFSQAALAEIDRRAVEHYHIPIVVLMENAGRAVADIALKQLALLSSSHVLIIAGPGNNGGDGLVAARHLHNAGIDVRILSTTSLAQFHEASALHLKTVQAMNIPIGELDASLTQLHDWIAQSDRNGVIIDAIFGTGLSRDVTGLPRQVIEAVNVSGRRVLAVDIPSGIHCDTGRPLGTAIRANWTISFCGYKRGFAYARNFTGKIFVGDIGAPASLLHELKDQA